MAILRVGKRARELEEAGLRHRFAFRDEDIHGTTSLPFSVFVEGDEHRGERVLEGTIHGHEVRAVDYPFFARTRPDRSPLGADTPAFRYERGTLYSCAVVTRLAVDLPFLHLSGRGRHSPLPAAADRLTPDHVGPVALTFAGWTDDLDFARGLLRGPLVDALVGTQGKVVVEFHRDSVCCVVAQLRAEEVPALMGLAVTLAERIPQQVRDRHPRQAEQDEPTDDTPRVVAGGPAWADVVDVDDLDVPPVETPAVDMPWPGNVTPPAPADAEVAAKARQRLEILDDLLERGLVERDEYWEGRAEIELEAGLPVTTPPPLSLPGGDDLPAGADDPTAAPEPIAPRLEDLPPPPPPPPAPPPPPPPPG